MYPLVRTPLALAAALTCLGATVAHAQTVPAPASAASAPAAQDKASQVDASAPTGQPQKVIIQVSADASKAGLAKSYAGGQVARGGRVGILGTQDMMDTPFTSIAYTQKLLQDQQAQSVGDAMLNDAAVRTARGYGNFQELYMMRGFPVYSDDMMYNGLYGLLPRQYVAAELAERVEVFRGASAFINGAAPGGSGLGGVINVMPKRAGAQPLTEVSTSIQSGGQAMLGLDLSRRFGPDHATGVRVNAVRRDGDTNIKNNSVNLSLLTVGVDWHSSDVRLSADIGWQDHKEDAPRPSVTPSGGIPKAPSATTNYAEPWTYAKERDTWGTVRGEYDLTNDSTVWLALGARGSKEENRLANPTSDADGNMTSYRYDNVRKDEVTTGELGWRGKFTTGPVAHEVSASYGAYAMDSKNAYGMSDFITSANMISQNLYHPYSSSMPSADYYTGGTLDDPLITERVRDSSFALADTLVMLNGNLRVNLGARRQTIEDTTYDYTSGAESAHYDKSRVTPMMGVLYKFGPQWSTYASYVEGIQQSTSAPTTSTVNGTTVTLSNGGEALAPYRTRQMELGVKWDGGDVGGNVDVFQIRKPTAGVVANGDGTYSYGFVDSVRHRGMEANVFGQPWQGIKLLGGISWIKAELLDSGKQALGVPRFQSNLGTEWTPSLLPDLTMSLRWVYTAKQWADDDNTMEVPSSSRWDVGATYQSEINSLPVTWRLRVDNLFNRSYWASAGGYPGSAYLVQSQPRTVTFGATVDF